MPRSAPHVTTYLWVVALLFSGAPVAHAGLMTFQDRGAFNAQGQIAYNYGFDDFGSGFSYPSNPWTTHGVTYTSTENLIIGTGTFHLPVSNVLSNNKWNPVSGLIESSAAQYDLFAFDLAYIAFHSSSTLIDLRLDTNLGSYQFSGLDVPWVSDGSRFYGFRAVQGEYFTGFSLVARSSIYSLHGPAIDNVTLGNAIVPEPTTLTLLGFGALTLVGYRWRRRQRIEEIR